MSLPTKFSTFIPILYDCKNYLIVNKPPFLYSQPPDTSNAYFKRHKRFFDPGIQTRDQFKDFVLNEKCLIPLLYHQHFLGNFEDSDSFQNINDKDLMLKELQPINRLDYNVSGALIISKNNITTSKFNRNLVKGGNSGHLIKRKYIAAVEIIDKNFDSSSLRHLKFLNPQNTLGLIDLPIDNKPSSTKFKILNSNCMILELLTGRKHQIRKHLNYINYNILGDKKYSLPLSYKNNYSIYNQKFNSANLLSAHHISPPFPQQIALHSAFSLTQVGLTQVKTYAPLIWNFDNVWKDLIPKKTTKNKPKGDLPSWIKQELNEL
ncbi:pseudouridine synthase PUS5 [Ascoidea rubescens DSM 1968]|uniref:21S rRNA pseudouridine(2819) synthase n=1 Tax=Ascoidea rubescens DSM 1968 TaxID=1344418 RepID=A0A1D2VDI4_9ASCO|nr:pseudouridine synthase [Ascoidea rubescens DSM 1968]ODV59570.1 pseudouridine synthase [Ascoidea rubescens DSM 1968]